jgi:hypothetical protein
MPELDREARRRGVDVIARPTAEACALLEVADPREVAADLHVIC